MTTQDCAGSSPAHEEFSRLVKDKNLTHDIIATLLEGIVSSETVKSWMAPRDAVKARNISAAALFTLKAKLNITQ